MPVFKTTIVFASGKRRIIYDDIDGLDLNTYYSRKQQGAKSFPMPIISFDAVQLSDLSPEAITVRESTNRK